MKILFDNGVPNPLARSLAPHDVAFARRIGWHELRNGELLKQAEDAGFDVLVTTDKNMRFQQNLAARKIAIVVLGNQQWPNVRNQITRIVQAVASAAPGTLMEVDIPYAS